MAAKAYSLSSVLMLILMHARVLNEEPLVLRGAEIAATGKLADPQSLLCYDGNDSPGGLTWAGAAVLGAAGTCELKGVCFSCRVSAVLHPPSLQQQPGQGGGRKQHHAAALPGRERKRPKIFYSPRERTFILPAGLSSPALQLQAGFAQISLFLLE